jgi:hypothetical protein
MFWGLPITVYDAAMNHDYHAVSSFKRAKRICTTQVQKHFVSMELGVMESARTLRYFTIS